MVIQQYTVDEWVEIVRGGLSKGTARTWSTYLTAIGNEFRGRALDSVLTSDIEGLRNRTVANALERAVSRQGASAGEGLVAAARAVWSRAITSGFATTNPALGAKKPPKSRAIDRRPLRRDELDAIWQVLASKTKDPSLALLVLRLALETGARRGEMLGLRYKSLENSSGCVRIAIGAKNYSTRAQPITRSLFIALEQFANERHKGRLVPTSPLLVNKKGEPITRRWFEGLAAKVRSEVPVLGVGGEVWFTWHLTRHTSGSLIERTAGYSVAQKFLGHEPGSQTGTTILYTKATLHEVRKAMAVVWQEEMAGDTR